MDLLNLLDELERMAESGVHLPGGRVLLNEADLRQLVGEIRTAAPDEDKISQRIGQDRDRVLNEARAQARRIVEEAQAQVNVRLEDQSAVQQARERARQIIADAERDSARVRAEANTYVANQLSALELRLQRVLHEVQSGQRYLTQPPAGRNETPRS